MLTARVNEINERIVQLETLVEKAGEEQLELYRELAIIRSFRKEEKVAVYGVNRVGIDPTVEGKVEAAGTTRQGAMTARRNPRKRRGTLR
tara:strand:+ start:1019 stop:1288 length:270 start_codon:yes stop_codon:yes gene_type:complete